MPPMVFLDPTTHNAPEHEEKFDEKLAKDAARQSVDKLTETCKEKLNHQYQPDQIISLIQIPSGKFIDATISAYKSVVDEKNNELRKESASIHLDVKESGGNFYFVAGLYGKPPADVYLESSYVLDLSQMKEAEYVKLVEGMEIDDKEHFIAVVKDAYYLAAKGQIDLAHVVIRRSEDGYCLEQELSEGINLHLSDETFNELDAKIIGTFQRVYRKSPETDEDYFKAICLTFRGYNIISGGKTYAMPGVVELTNNSSIDPMTPEELGRSIVRGERRQAWCVPVSLLVKEILEKKGCHASVIGIARINEDGSENKEGHATAAVASGGFVIDPSIFNEPVPIKLAPESISFDSKDIARYSKTVEWFQQTYNAYLPSFSYEISEEKTSEQIGCLYYSNRGAKKQARREDYISDMLMAYEQNRVDVNASIFAGNAQLINGDINKAAEIYLSALVEHPNSYLACFKIGMALFNIEAGGTHPFAEMALEILKKATELKPDMAVAAYGYCLVAKALRKDAERKEMASCMADNVPKDSEFKQLFVQLSR